MPSRADFDLTTVPSLPSHRHSVVVTLHSPLGRPSFSFVSVDSQNAVDNAVCRLNGSARCVHAAPTPARAPELTVRAAKPATALLPFRAASAAFISSTSSNNATPAQQSPGLVAGAPGTPPPMKLARREVPLPSQEGKKGAMQYALYVT